MLFGTNHQFYKNKNKELSQNSRTRAEEMVVELQAAFINILKSTTWLDDDTLAVAIEKVQLRYRRMAIRSCNSKRII